MPTEATNDGEMTASGGDAQAADQVAGAASKAVDVTPVSRRPYHPPQLRSLGKVAELTFGKGSKHLEAQHTKHD